MAHNQAQEAIRAARDGQHELDGITMDLHEAKAALSLIKVGLAVLRQTWRADCRSRQSG